MARLALMLVAGIVCAFTGAQAIGTVKARGGFRVDNAEVWGNGTLFEGNAVETNEAASDLEISSGSKISLGARSRSRIFRDRVVIEKGSSQVRAGKHYLIEARSLRIIPAGDSKIEVAVNGPRAVQVAAIVGAAEVHNAQGLLVANVTAGRTLEFVPQAGASAAVQVAGCVSRNGSAVYLKDDTTGVLFELRGSDIAEQAGKAVEVTGAVIPGLTAIDGTSQVVSVTAAKSSGKRCQASAVAAGGASAGTAAAGAAGAAAAGTGAGIAAGTIAVIGGVAAAATVGGLYATGTIGSRSTSSR